jgi:microcystin synthetase protein McyJ
MNSYGKRLMFNTISAIKSLASMTRMLVRSDPADYYQYLGDDLIEGQTAEFKDPNKPLWLNLGYWKTARTYPDAAREMAKELGDAAQLCRTDNVLDVGFGFAEQDIYWTQTYDVARITGLNITPFQVERARKRVQARGLDDRIDLGMGSATQMPFGANTFTKVTALECAFHFHTREQFFHEAFRVLTPGGRIALADGIPQVGSPAPSLRTKWILRHWATPLANYYDQNEYKRKLEACGFVNVMCRSISDDVFAYNLKYMDARRAGGGLNTLLPELSSAEVAQNLKRWSHLGLTDYVIVTADKPAA